MALIHFNESTFDEALNSKELMMVDFWATWCGPCKALAPVIDELAEEYADRVVIGKYNVEEEGELSNTYRIMALPTILFFKNGERVDRLTGSQTKETLKAKIESLL